MDLGKEIRTLFSKYHDEEFGISWEVDSAVDAFSVFSSRWTTEILATLYIAGDRRFNEMRSLLRGISSRTLSDKLTTCVGFGLVGACWRWRGSLRMSFLFRLGRVVGRRMACLMYCYRCYRCYYYCCC